MTTNDRPGSNIRGMRKDDARDLGTATPDGGWLDHGEVADPVRGSAAYQDGFQDGMRYNPHNWTPPDQASITDALVAEWERLQVKGRPTLFDFQDLAAAVAALLPPDV